MVSAETASSERQRRLLRGRLEIARFIEDVVGRQQHFVLPERDAPALQHGGAVVDREAGGRAGARHRSANDADVQRRGVGGQALQVLLGPIQEAFFFEQDRAEDNR